jgi:hypothetical protein
MGRNPKIKLYIKTEKQLNAATACKCGNIQPLRDMYFYVDESNIAITNNAKPKCKGCAIRLKY